MATVLSYGLSGLGRVALHPLFTGPLLLSALYRPDTIGDALTHIAQFLPEQVTSYLPTTLDTPTAITTLQFLLGFGIIRKINTFLNTLASNSWRAAPAPNWDWPREIAVITGGSSGIGACMAHKLAAHGIRIAVLDIQPLPSDLASNPLISYYQCDVTSSSSVEAAASSVRRDLGHATILINNAGVAGPAPILKTDEKFLRKIMGVNLMSMWFTTQAFLPNMIQTNKGHIVTVASIASFVALLNAADYSATKAGALAFHETLAQEIKHVYKAPNVLTTVVHPNFVSTPLVKDFEDKLKKAGVKLMTGDRVAEEIVQRVLSRRGGQVVIPQRETVISSIRGWPTWLQEALRDYVSKGSVEG
ncbi:hypothetical protein OQA88_3263 [Cercophora sp. LCS_1]